MPLIGLDSRHITYSDDRISRYYRPSDGRDLVKELLNVKEKGKFRPLISIFSLAPIYRLRNNSLQEKINRTLTRAGSMCEGEPCQALSN